MTGKLVEDLFLTGDDMGATFYSPSLPMGGLNGAMLEVWITSAVNLKNSDGLVAVLEGSDDGFNWLDVDASLRVETDAIVTPPRYLSAHNTAVIISYGFVRVRFLITAEAATTATALVSAAVRVYRAT